MESEERGRPRLTVKGERTRARIVEAAARLIYEHGVASTTLDDVKSAAEVSGSQLYHYFPDKDELVQAVINYQADVIARNQRQVDLGSAEGLRAWRDMVIAQARSDEGKGGCPLGSLAGQLAENDPHARTLLDSGFGQWQAAIGEGLRRLHQAGQLPDGTDPDALAVTLLATLQGGLLLAQVQRDPRPLETAVDTLLQLARSGLKTGDTDAVPYDPTTYLGSAAHYRFGRPAYSPELEAVLTREAGLDGTGRLLDAGCGPGVLTVRLAHLFAQAIGLDPDTDMLAEGRRAAEGHGVTNIRWVQGLAEDLPAVAPGPYRLVTFGQSFQWTDERRVAETVYDMLEPGGALALIGHTVAGRPRPPDPGVPPIPHDEIEALVEQYLGSTRRAGQGTAPERTHRFEDVLTRTRFGVPRQFFVPGIPDLVRTSESVLSGYFSFSFSAPHLFGDRLDDFAGEVRALLASRSAEGVFWDWPGDTEVVMARKPGSSPGTQG